jgi:hypothetical protein
MSFIILLGDFIDPFLQIAKIKATKKPILNSITHSQTTQNECPKTYRTAIKL